MERISEADNEDEKHNTITEKQHNDLIYKDDLKIDENFKEYMNKNINSSNLNENFDQNFHNTESTYRLMKDFNQNRWNQNIKSTEQNERISIENYVFITEEYYDNHNTHSY